MRVATRLAEGAVIVGDTWVLRLGRGREVLDEEQIRRGGDGHVEDESRALLLGRGHHDMAAARFAHDDRLSGWRCCSVSLA